MSKSTSNSKSGSEPAAAMSPVLPRCVLEQFRTADRLLADREMLRTHDADDEAIPADAPASNLETRERGPD